MCKLETDLTQLPYGDSSTVQEKGSALSGGQKVRVNLARYIAIIDCLLIRNTITEWFKW